MNERITDYSKILTEMFATCVLICSHNCVKCSLTRSDVIEWHVSYLLKKKKSECCNEAVEIKTGSMTAQSDGMSAAVSLNSNNLSALPSEQTVLTSPSVKVASALQGFDPICTTSQSLQVARGQTVLTSTSLKAAPTLQDFDPICTTSQSSQVTQTSLQHPKTCASQDFNFINNAARHSPTAAQSADLLSPADIDDASSSVVQMQARCSWPKRFPPVFESTFATASDLSIFSTESFSSRLTAADALSEQEEKVVRRLSSEPSLASFLTAMTTVCVEINKCKTSCVLTCWLNSYFHLHFAFIIVIRI